jgi:hypothetical protein
VAIKEVKFNRIPSKDSVIYVNRSGISFSASFVKKFNLQDSTHVKFYLDDEDIYFLGFSFSKNKNGPNSLALVASGRSKGGSAGFTLKAAELFGKNLVLRNIAKQENKADKTFEVSYSKATKIFSVLFRPNFEFSVGWNDRNKISENILGIYRYLGASGEILYIGKGNIRSRASSPERAQWGIKVIEYSVINDDEKCYHWEDFYLEAFVASYGAKPPFNVILGKKDSSVTR